MTTNWNFEPISPSDSSKLADEVYSDRVKDLMDKLERTLDEAKYPVEEVLPALGYLLTTRFLEADNPDRLFRIFIQMLSERFDHIMDELENEE